MWDILVVSSFAVKVVVALLAAHELSKYRFLGTSGDNAKHIANIIPTSVKCMTYQNENLLFTKRKVDINLNETNKNNKKL